MTVRARAIFGALLFCGGLLFATGGSVYKSSDRIRYQRDVDRHKPDPLPAQTAGGNFSIGLGLVCSVGGAVLLGFAFRDMVRQIGDAQSRAEAAMRMETAAPREPKPKA